MSSILRIAKDRLNSLSPLALAKLALTGSLLLTLTFFLVPEAVVLQSIWRHLFGAQWNDLRIAATLILLLLPLPIGAAIDGIALDQLSKGLRNGRWMQAQRNEAHLWIESVPVRKIANRYLWTSRFLMGAACLIWAVSAHWKLPTQVTAKLMTLWGVWLNAPRDTFASLRSRLSPPAATPLRRTGPPMPLHSDHWGRNVTKSETAQP